MNAEPSAAENPRVDAHRPTPEEARASLDEAAESRRAAAEASRPPLWMHVTLAVVLGVAVGLMAVQLRIGALILLCVGMIPLLVLERRLTRSRGRIADGRAFGAGFLRFGLVYALIFLVAQFEPDPAWQPWYAIGAAVLTGVCSFVYVRWDERYQARRRAAGDYGRYELL